MFPGFALALLPDLAHSVRIFPWLCFHRMFKLIRLCIPFFMLAGQFMSFGGITRRLVKLSEALVGNLRGGLAHITIVASMFFAGITGSGAAEAAAIGSLMIPSMVEKDMTSNSRFPS
jgi:C4-dicarboxylate transporter DctM subunit